MRSRAIRRNPAPRRLHPRRPGDPDAPGRILHLFDSGRLKTVVPVIPDAPIGHFRLTLFGGDKGYLSNTEDLCTLRPRRSVEFNGQNGKSTTQKVKTEDAMRDQKGKEGLQTPFGRAPLSAGAARPQVTEAPIGSIPLCHPGQRP